MEKNQLIKCQGIIYRVLAVEEDSILLIDCTKKSGFVLRKKQIKPGDVHVELEKTGKYSRKII